MISVVKDSIENSFVSKTFPFSKMEIPIVLGLRSIPRYLLFLDVKHSM
jgi:hypothetical protein